MLPDNAGMSSPPSPARLLLLLFALLAAPVHALELRMLISWDENYPGVPQMAERFARKVDEASGGEVTFALTGPDSIPAFEQLLPVSLGIFDLLFTHGGFHLETTGIGLALDAVDTDPETLHSSGIWNAVDQAYQKHGLKLLAIPVASTGYQVFLREPLTQNCSLDGRTIRAAPSYARLLESLGARPVSLPIGEVHDALRDKTIDGVAWSTIGALNFKWYEVNRYLMRPTFGVASHLLLMNLDTWANLPLDLQRLLLEQGGKLEQKAVTRFRKVAASEMNDLNVTGMQISSLCHKGARRVKREWAEGIWHLATDSSGNEVRALRELAQKAGVTPSNTSDDEKHDEGATTRQTPPADEDVKHETPVMPPSAVPDAPSTSTGEHP